MKKYLYRKIREYFWVFLGPHTIASMYTYLHIQIFKYYSQHSIQSDSVKCESDHVTPLLKTFQLMASYGIQSKIPSPHIKLQDPKQCSPSLISSPTSLPFLFSLSDTLAPLSFLEKAKMLLFQGICSCFISLNSFPQKVTWLY